jgi:hypothetical protein
VHEKIPFDTALTSLVEFGENVRTRIGLQIHGGPLSLNVINWDGCRIFRLGAIFFSQALVSTREVGYKR